MLFPGGDWEGRECRLQPQSSPHCQLQPAIQSSWIWHYPPGHYLSSACSTRAPFRAPPPPPQFLHFSNRLFWGEAICPWPSWQRPWKLRHGYPNFLICRGLLIRHGSPKFLIHVGFPNYLLRFCSLICPGGSPLCPCPALAARPFFRISSFVFHL